MAKRKSKSKWIEPLYLDDLCRIFRQEAEWVRRHFLERRDGIEITCVVDDEGRFLYTTREWLWEMQNEIALTAPRSQASRVVKKTIESESQKDEILRDYHGPMTCAEVAEILDVSERTVARRAGEEDKEGVVVVIKVAASAWYIHKSRAS